MRILLILNTLTDSRSISGGLVEYVNMANAWIEAGHRTDFFAPKAGWPPLQRLAPKAGLVSSDNVFDATKYLAKTWRYFPAYAYRLLTPHWVRLPIAYDVIYACSQFIADINAARVLLRRYPARFVVKIQHVVAGQPNRTGLVDRLFIWAEGKSARWINREAELLLCLSRTVGEHYQEFERSLGLTPHPIVPNGCGIDLSRFDQLPNLPKKYDVVVLGRMHEQKGVFELPSVWAKVVARHPAAKLVVIGEGPHRARTEAMFVEKGLTGSVRITGPIPEAEKNQLLAESRIGLSLSYEEGWGLSVTEFLATGLPVVAYELPVFNEVFPGQLELVPLHDQEGAAARILELLSNESRRQALGQQGKAFVRRYDYRTLAFAELEKIRQILPPSVR